MATADTRDVGVALVSQLSPATSGGTNPFAKLLQHQTKEAEVTKEKLKQLTKFKEDYEALKTRLETLPDKLTHEVMVPLGKLAYMPGHIKHTNEILCLLGDNWFVERSAKQAVQIIDRRIADCSETLKKLQEELRLRGGWCDHTKKLSDELGLNQGVNITEVEEDDSWREEHRRRVREYKQKVAALKQQQQEEGEKESQETSKEEELWRRLDILELEEELQHELDLLGSEEEEEEEGSDVDEDENDEESTTASEKEPSKKKKSVRWSESPDCVKQFHRDELILPRTSSATAHGDDEDQDMLKITFKHTVPNKRTSKVASSASVIGPAAADCHHPSSSTVSNPSDIFRKFGAAATTESSSGESVPANEPKSILKVKKSTTPVMEVVQQEEQETDTVPAASGVEADATAARSLLQQQQTPAVGDEVKERGETASSAATAGIVADHESVNTHRPVSRFRAARMNKQL